jgi:Ca-activated chloride channel family protein
MWPGAEWEALRTGAVDVESLVRLWTGLLAVALVTAVALIRGPTRVRVPESWRGHGFSFRIDATWLLSLTLRSGALGLIVVALARPVGLLPENPAGGRGIELVIALDASGSMKALDATLAGRRVTRLELAKRVVADFIRQREGDRIGLVVFGEHAFTQCPLTVDHRLVLAALDRIEVGIAGDATALGEAIGLGVRRLRVSGGPSNTRHILLLLTDGRHNSGRLGPETAAKIARLEQVRVHTVGVGTSGSVPFAQDHPGEPLRFEEVDLDRETLQAVASISQGRFFHAEHPEDLATIAAAIDEIEAHPYAPEPRYRRASLSSLTLLAALFLLLLEAATTHGVLRRLP